MITIIVGALTLVGYLLFKMLYKSPGSLPGPLALPVIGHLHLIGGKSMHVLLRDMSHTYGDVFRLKLGSKETVILSTRKAIQEAFVKQAKTFAARPDLPTFEWTRNGQTGVSLCTYTEEYKVNKSISVAALHSFLNNPEHMDIILRGEMEKMNQLLDTYAETQTPFYPFDEFRRIVPSVFVALLFNHGRDYDDPVMAEVRETYKVWFDVAEADNPADFFPFMLNFPNKRLSTAKQCGNVFESFTMSMIEEYGKASSGEDVEESELSLFDTLVRQYSKKNTVPLTHAEKLRLAKILSDMIGGGFDTGAATLSWAMLYLMSKPDILQKCREEVKKRTTDGIVSTTMMKEMPYMLATLYDIYRLSSVAPLGLAHEVAKDTTLMGCRLPKGTMVLANLWQANNDPDRWKNPDTLNPDHFLKDDGEIDVNATRELMTFSTGVRSCPGKDIAFSNSFVMLATLIDRFEFAMVEKPEDWIPERGLTLKPKRYTITLSKLR